MVGRGRPAIVSKATMELPGDLGAVVVKLVGEGDTVQIELPYAWDMTGYTKSITKAGGLTKLSLQHDA